MSVVLKDARETEEVTLPVSKGKVVLYKGLLFGDVDNIPQDDHVGAGKALLMKVIKSWDFVDENKKELEVNEDNLKLLTMEDVKVLIEKSNKTISDIEKKKDS